VRRVKGRFGQTGILISWPRKNQKKPLKPIERNGFSSGASC
jgi:hypothetical protein